MRFVLTYTANDASSRVTSPEMDRLALFMATLPAQPVGTANEVFVPLGMTPGGIGPPTGVGLPALLACAVVMSCPSIILSLVFISEHRTFDRRMRRLSGKHSPYELVISIVRCSGGCAIRPCRCSLLGETRAASVGWDASTESWILV